ncbi:adenylate/guanylate cyclase domain-containing protein [Oceanicella sp. SM1341]|uniref:adenylate/guanylate cyclase domain-containing protein n=1 Tax=Oceanicella sp. SM1341 TaxID=1548889 RepID=UPI000E4C3769|nr:adenylate/guanylate cyclase domain-containing protein [Oceanicella sp. SM1341]
MKIRPPLNPWIGITLAVACSGLLYSWVVYDTALRGAVYATAICLPIIAFERGLFLRRLRRRILELPTLAYLLVETLVYGLMLALGFMAVGTVIWAAGWSLSDWRGAALPGITGVAYGLVTCTLIIAILRVRDLIGHHRFKSLLIGRYRRPVREERIFLFIDLAGSSAYAEAHGDLKVMELLSALFSAMEEPVRANRGSVEDLVGDAVIISWPMEEGLHGARCLTCLRDVIAAVEARAEWWQARFGMVPALRAALHGGPVIVAEVGVEHHKITYFGDTVNITARIEELCRAMDEPRLISADLAARLTLPHGIALRALGPQPVRGRDHDIGVCAIDIGPPAARESLRRRLARRAAMPRRKPAPAPANPA